MTLAQPITEQPVKIDGGLLVPMNLIIPQSVLEYPADELTLTAVRRILDDVAGEPQWITLSSLLTAFLETVATHDREQVSLAFRSFAVTAQLVAGMAQAS